MLELSFDSPKILQDATNMRSQIKVIWLGQWIKKPDFLELYKKRFKPAQNPEMGKKLLFLAKKIASMSKEDLEALKKDEIVVARPEGERKKSRKTGFWLQVETWLANENFQEMNFGDLQDEFRYLVFRLSLKQRVTKLSSIAFFFSLLMPAGNFVIISNDNKKRQTPDLIQKKKEIKTVPPIKIFNPILPLH